MTPTEARKAKIGSVVKWESSGEQGKIVERGEAGIRVKWDDGTDAVYLYAAVSCGLLHLQAVR